MLSAVTRLSAPARTMILSVTLLAGAAAVVLAVGVRGPASTAAATITTLIVTGAFYVAEQHLISFEFRRQSHSMTFAGVPMAVGVLLLPVGDLVLARLVGSLIALLIQHISPQKILYNIAAYCFEAALVGAAVGVLTPSPEQLGILRLAGMIACVVILDQVMSTLVLLVIRMHGGRFTGREVAEVLLPSAVLSSLSTAFGVALVLLNDLGVAGRALDVVLVSASVVAYRAYAATQRQHRSLATVHHFVTADGTGTHSDRGGDSGTGPASLVDALHRSLVGIRSILGAACVELLLHPADAAGETHPEYVRISLNEDDEVSSAPAHASRTDWVRSRAMHLGEPTLAPRRGQDPAAASWLQHENFQDAIVVPLQTGGDILGAVTVADRLAANVTFLPEDLTMLQTLTSHLAVSVRSARLFETLSHQATHDPLTGLVNRTALATRITALDHSTTTAALMLLDLDKFKEVNDVLGHDVGDQLLVAVAGRLRDALPTSVTVARLGGDEFAILIPELGTDEPTTAEMTAQRLLAALVRPVRFDDVLICPEASIGIALTSDVNPQRLMRCADTAMYVAKTGEDSIATYRPDMDIGRAERLALIADLRLALEDTPEQFALYYQPKLDLETDEIVGAEALVRWMHPERGMVMPDSFIPLAEATGLIDQLTRHVLARALADSARWHRAGHEVGVAVNLSPRNLTDETLAAQVSAALTAARAEPGWLTLEITETVMMQDANRAVRVLHELTDLGVTLSLDDFGTGYSSLAYLQRLPVHELKIDKSFVAALSVDRASPACALFRSITALAANLSLRVVAEGIETPQHLTAVTDMGCNTAQGYLISRPVPAADLLTWLGARTKDRPAELHLVATANA